MINTVIIDTKKQDRDRIAELLSAGDDIKILACGKDGYDALKLTGSMKPDIIILDNHLEFIEGNEIPPLLKARSPSTMVVILAGKISDYQLYRAVSNKVSGFVDKETDMDILPGILKYIYRGGCYFSPALATRILHLFSQIDSKSLNAHSSSLKIKERGPELRISSGDDPVGHLSKMELNIMRSLANGMDSDDIALQFGLAVGTVRNYISQLMNKLGLKNRIQMVRYAFSHGIVPIGREMAYSGKALNRLPLQNLP